VFRIGVAVHLLDWRVAKFQVKACNPSGCGVSNIVGVDGLALDAMGYFKPNGPGNSHLFGHTVALSADGRTMAIATGETLAGQADALVVHVYRRMNSPSGWRREARLEPPHPQRETSEAYIGTQIALNGDGSRLVVGVPTYGEPVSGTSAQYGMGLLYARDDAGWHLAQTFMANKNRWNRFGERVDIDESGDLVAFTYSYPTGAQYEPGTVQLYRHTGTANGSYSLVNTVTVPYPGNGRRDCNAISVSGNGQRLFRACGDDIQVIHVAADFAWTELARFAALQLTNLSLDSTFDGRRLLVPNGAGASIFDETPAGWIKDGAVGNHGGSNVELPHNDGAISRDGKIIALGNREETGAGIGPVYSYESVAVGSGAVIIYERKPAGWRERRTVKPGSTGAQWAGHSVALGDNGRILAVGAPFESSAASGIGGDREDTSAPERGAVWLY
jgi:hypothetical protein